LPGAALASNFPRADSMIADIAEGNGRWQQKENLNFCFYSRGSFKGNRHMAGKGENRNLVSIEKFEELNQLCESLSVELNNYIRLESFRGGRYPQEMA
jgi:four helix bundle protein